MQNISLNYHVTSLVHLSLESFHNAGLTPEQTKEEIEKVQDGTSRVWCEPSGINRNWNVRTIRTGALEIYDLVQTIEERLNALLHHAPDPRQPKATRPIFSTEWLAARRIKYDPTGTGTPRYTHEPTGRAAVRQPYMDDALWQKEIEAFGRAMELENQRI